LKAEKNNLDETSTALRVLLKMRDRDKAELEENILFNVKQLVFPLLEKLKKSRLNNKQISCISILESNLKNIISQFPCRLFLKYLNLSPSEVRVANLVREGKTTKEIAELFNLSGKTIESYRKNIRKKIGIKNKKANLRSHLLSIKQ